ncbi:enoyl-CoA hydratase/isomerase family protein [Yinghuangia soli]|uniref:Enoyl-CoA hydratase-related protein n=1 Tax=Yinghuangia soli TaxID=2908204 RepID=A0AA41TYF1_9ACTN|nr:enoyl-CoA hydratase-related protein [Yinghuangia soli]MCF2526110.1 enoyl-CoA hydratase-related protein [Yinghuangia soli]
MSTQAEEPAAGPPVRVDISAGVAVVTLDRPERLNVFSGGMGVALGAAYARCDADDRVRAVVLTGAGRAFCAGADLTPAAGAFDAPKRAREFTASPVDPPAWRLRKPVIAAVNGHAIGIGFTLAMECDLRFVAADAKLAIPQVRRGMVPDARSHWTVTRAASQAVAADILLTGRTFLGTEAVALGLASRALPADEVLPAALAAARDIADNVNPLSAALSKRLLWLDSPGPDRVEALETAYHRLLMGSPDAKEGPRAWAERRVPEWTGRVSEEWDRVLDAERALDAKRAWDAERVPEREPDAERVRDQQSEREAEQP